MRALMLLLAGMLLCASAAAQAPPFEARTGRVDLGFAILQVPAGWLFFDAASTGKLLEAGGYATDGSELGALVPPGDEADYLVVLSYREPGTLPPPEGPPDPDRLFRRLEARAERDNEVRRARRLPARTVVGWAAAPSYDAKRHAVRWSVKVDSGPIGAVQHAVRRLGRFGVLALDLVAEPGALASVEDLAVIDRAVEIVDGRRWEDRLEEDPMVSVDLDTVLVHAPGFEEEDEAGGSSGLALALGGVGAALAVGGGAWWLRRRAAAAGTEDEGG